MECFHCGLPVGSAAYPVRVDGVTHETCCRGCQAVAQTIADNGLAAYYTARSALPPSPQARASRGDDLAVYDLGAIQKTFVQTGAEPNRKDAALLIDGVTCAACMWLIEHRLVQLNGVTNVALNYASLRLRVSWDERRLRLSDILRAIRQLGYGAQPYDGARRDDGLRVERRTMIWRLFVSGFAMMQVMMYAIPAYIDDGAMSAEIDRLMRVASLILTIPVVAWAAAPFYRAAWRQLHNRQVGTDVPISAGILIAFGASAIATISGAGEVYFDSVSMFVFLLLGARFLELGARAKAASAQERLLRLVPALAEKVDAVPPRAEPQQVAAATLERGDLVLVRPGATVPADGVVIDGKSSVDESLITGESRAVRKEIGDRLVGGAVNKRNALVMRVERVGQETVLAGIVKLMDRAQGERPRIAEAADRAARRFVVALLVLTVVAAGIWYAIDPTRVLWITIALLVVSCPCALSLATPVALTAATGSLYRGGVLVTRGHALEALARATHYVFDKTGTLTAGRMTLIGVMPLSSESRENCLSLAAALELQSEHPIGHAIVSAAELNPAEIRVSALRNVTGRGIQGRIKEREVRIGSPDFVAELHHRPLPRELSFVSEDVTVVALGNECGWLALLSVGDTLRRDARRMVGELKAQGKTVCLLSGDRQARANRIARELGITVVRGDAKPSDKVDFVRSLQKAGAVVAMVGDGVNDAPVLSQAHVSLALGGGTRLAQMSADIVLMSERLQPVLDADATARRTLRVVRQNIAWAVLYNAIALPLAALGQVTPLVAGIGMSLSSLAVVLNALRLLPEAKVGTEHEHGIRRAAHQA